MQKHIFYQDIYDLLESKYDFYNRPSFIENDPISIPHSYTKKEDIEIAAFIAATLSWGTRVSIIKNAKTLINYMDNSPHDFVINAKENDLQVFTNFVHRTFNSDDCIFYMQAIKSIYKKHGGFEKVLTNAMAGSSGNALDAITKLRTLFFKLPHQSRTEKHFSDPEKGSAAKRINMFLRWMVRNDGRGVDFGLWKNISTAKLICPLDIHSGNVARKLDLLGRKQNTRKSALELTEALKIYDAKDPAKYDFALFGLGVYENF